MGKIVDFGLPLFPGLSLRSRDDLGIFPAPLAFALLGGTLAEPFTETAYQVRADMLDFIGGSPASLVLAQYIISNLDTPFQPVLLEERHSVGFDNPIPP